MATAVLIVDDDQDTCDALAAVLRDAGYEARCVNDGAAGLRELRNGAPDIVVLELDLPHGEGTAFLTQKTADRAIAAIPVIAMSDSAQPVPRDGVVEVLHKPFDLQDLLRALADARN